MIVFLAMLCGFVYYVMNEQERQRALRPVRAVLRHVMKGAVRGAADGRRAGLAIRARDPLALAVCTAVVAIGGAVSLYALHLRTLTDVRPELDRVFAIEDRTAGTYQAAVRQFRLGALSAEALADVIERRIEPELEAARLRLAALDRVPREHQPLVASAARFVRLRHESWQLRARALDDHSLAALLSADNAERASLAALEDVKRASEQH